MQSTDSNEHIEEIPRVADEDSEGFVTDNEILSEEEEQNEIEELEDKEDEEEVFNETVIERIIALRDAVPYSLTQNFTKLMNSGYRTGRRALNWIGTATWIITTSAAIVLLPLAMEIEKESAAVAQETQMANQQAQAQQIVQ